MTVWLYAFTRYLQSPLSFANANSRYLLHFWSRKCRLKNVRHLLSVLLRSTPLFHHHSIFILYYLFYVHHHGKSSNHFTPVIVIVFIHHIILALCIRSCMYAQVIYFVSGVVTRSVLFILRPPDFEGWRICVGTTLINEFTYICLYVNTVRLWVVWRQMCDPCSIWFYLNSYWIQMDMCLSTVQISNASQS